MPGNEQTGNAPTGGAVGIGADQGASVHPPEPSALSAETVGAVGPGALAASESPAQVTASGLTADDIEVVRGLARRAGGVEALIRWLEAHRDLK